MKGETVGGVRISHLKPKIAKPLLTKDNIVMWNHAKTAYKKDGNFIRVFKKADITPENQRLMISEINAEDAANV